MLLGMLIAFAGLLVLLLPGVSAAVGQCIADGPVRCGLGGVYATGQRLAQAAGRHCRQFRPQLAVPGAAATDAVAGGRPAPTPLGLLYALGSGVLASGAGYAVWYGVVRQISAQQAATLQLSVPVIAALGGVALIGESVSLRLLIACVVVLGGIALALAPRR
jgi:drug/metabolite transporter (DMT)-like permease